MASEEIRQLQLSDGEHNISTLYRLRKGWILHFTLGPDLQARKIRVFANHPPKGSKKPFNRQEFYELQWQSPSKSQCDDSDNFCEIHLHLAGTFQYYFTSDNSNNQLGSGYFLVDPVLQLSSDVDFLPLDCITLQTVLTKNMGPFSEWEKRLQVAKESGYNMIHFTPVSQLGFSNSAYSLSDQLSVHDTLHDKDKKVNFDDVESLVIKMQHEWGMLSICDVVWNHTSFDSPWLLEHPECAYNVVNTPHLRPAYVLDRILWHFTLEIIEGKWEDKGISKNINSEEQLMRVHHELTWNVVSKHRLEEYYQCNVEVILDLFRDAASSGTIYDKPFCQATDVKLNQDPDYRRLRCYVDLQKALQCFNIKRSECKSETVRLDRCCSDFKAHLHELNKTAAEIMFEDLRNAVNNIVANVRYFHVEHHGPRIEEISQKNPIVHKYFRHWGPDTTVRDEEVLMNEDKAPFLQVGNGWVMNSDPLSNFAEPPSKVYLRRELICWGDSVKLRYGNRPEECPYLWEHMLKYTKLMAKIFHGLRIDNCHSTPIHVAEYLLDEARKVRSDLYVVAELFTSSEKIDNMFVNRMGINSLIREAMSAGDSHEEGRLVYKYGGVPVGSFLQPHIRPLQPSVAHALLMDITHDNPCPIKTRSVYDPLPSAALVSMACCAVGSSRGYDELVPHHIHVVDETRQYACWNESSKADPSSEVAFGSGIIAAKRALNQLHQWLGVMGYSQVYVDQVDTDIVAVTRHCPSSHQSVILVARTAFKHPGNPHYTGYVPPLCVPGIIDEIILEAKLVQLQPESIEQSKTYINGLSNYTVEIQQHIKLLASGMVELSEHGADTHAPVQELDFINFPPGSVIAFKVSLKNSARASLSALRNCISQFGYRVRSLSGNSPSIPRDLDFVGIASKLSLADMNRVLYRCEVEERDDGKGFGPYNIPNHGSLTYCGLQGYMSVLADIRTENDLGHALCENLRQGDWMPGVIANRLKAHAKTRPLGKWFETVFQPLSQVPRYLIPCYFDAVMVGTYMVLLELCWKKMGQFVNEGSPFVKALALGSVQMCGVVKTAPLPELSPSLHGIPTTVNEESGKREQDVVTMAAGLPHFAGGFMRCWGRDTFLAMPGLMLLTERYDEAKYIILAFAGTLRHGLIPNLLGGGAHARYNCRDAVWFWLYCIQLYCKMAKEGVAILECPISRIFPEDDSEAQPPGFVEHKLCDVIHEALQRHVEGISYRERHAGPGLDQNMSHQGFSVTVGVDPDTGFPFGGGEWNCGTWMDKVGESEIAGTKGKPATPRDGSAVEIVGLCKAALRWLVQLNQEGKYQHSEFNIRIDGKPCKLTYKDWDARIKANFEENFWIASDANKQVNKLINKQGMYKDSVGATHFWADYQLRPNFPIAMVVAPELFVPQHAWIALQTCEKHLLGPLGMKTLDPDDWAYVGDYDNGYDGSDAKRARGFNYHLGPANNMKINAANACIQASDPALCRCIDISFPKITDHVRCLLQSPSVFGVAYYAHAYASRKEWVWPVGYFLRAKLHFSCLQNKPDLFRQTVTEVQKVLTRHHKEVNSSVWRGIPELTNKDGAYCKDSCPTQAWSMSCILELLYDLDRMVKSNVGT